MWARLTPEPRQARADVIIATFTRPAPEEAGGPLPRLYSCTTVSLNPSGSVIANARSPHGMSCGA